MKDTGETKKCKYCQSDIPKKAKVCPVCKKKQGGRGCLIAVGVVVALGIIGAAAGGGSSSSSNSSVAGTPTAKVEETTAAPIEYTAYNVADMMNDLKSNAMNASDKYKGQYLEITGKLSVIDSNGKYISITPDDPFAILGVQCYIKSDEQKDAIKTKSIGDSITVKGKCTDVGEVLGYSLDIDSVE